MGLLNLSDFDISNEASPGKKTKYNSGYFVAPDKHLQMYGYKKQYVTKLKKELEDAGFIETVCGKHSPRGAYNEGVTLYRFTGSWKSKNQ